MARNGGLLQTIGPAAIYFSIVFAAGFVLGAVRTLVLVPRAGPLAAVAIELPLMLYVSWRACRWTVQRFAVPATTAHRLGMGAIAFALLMAAEFELTAGLLAITPASLPQCTHGPWPCFAATMATPQGLLGLLGQILFAAMPLIDMRRTSHAP